MPVLIFLIILAAMALWFLLAFTYRPLGKLFKKVYKDSMDAINKEDEGENENE